MTKNMGNADRVIRGIIGLAVIGWGVMASSWWGALGVIPLGTAFLATCPGYVPFGIKTCKTAEE